MKYSISTLSLSLLLVGCAQKGTVTAKAPMTQPISSFKKVAVMVEAQDPSATNAAKHVSSLKEALSVRLNQSGLFDEVMTNEGASGDLQMKVVITKVDDGSVLGMAGGADAEVTVSVDLVDAAKGGSVGQLEATGNSKSNVKTSVGGVSTDAMKDRVTIALNAAADQVVDFLKQQNEKN